MNVKKMISMLLFFAAALSLVSCQTQLKEIDLNQFINEQGLYQYSDVVWGSSPVEVRDFFGKDLGKPLDFNDGVTQYTIEGLFGYKGIPAQVICEFFNDKLYEIRFNFSAKDAEDVDFDTIFSDIAKILIEEYGNADTESFNKIVEVFDVKLKTDSYQWKSSTEEKYTSLQLVQTIKDEVNDLIFIGVFDASFSSIQEE